MNTYKEVIPNISSFKNITEAIRSIYDKSMNKSVMSSK